METSRSIRAAGAALMLVGWLAMITLSPLAGFAVSLLGCALSFAQIVAEMRREWHGRTRHSVLERRSLRPARSTRERGHGDVLEAGE